MSRTSPQYPLRDVCDLAKAGKVTFSKNAQKDYLELGYTYEQAMECVAWLTDNEFRSRYSVEGTDICWDDYVTTHKVPGAITRELYVKLRIPTPASVDYVYVTSFHTQRPMK